MGLAVALTSWAMARSAEAADAEVPARVSLRWTAPDECPDDAQVVSAVEQRLGESLQRARPQQLVVRAHVVGARGAYSAKLRFEGPNGVEERYLEHPDCQKLMQASALVMALTIDPERVSAREHEGEVASEGDRSSPPVASATPPRPPSAAEEQAAPRSEVGAREPAPPTERSTRVVFSGYGLLGGGVLPRASAGLGLGLALSRRHFSAGLVGRYWLPRSEQVPAVSGAEVELSLASLGLRACATPWLGGFRLSGCAGLELAYLQGSGVGLENDRTRGARFGALSLGLLLSRKLEPLTPFLGVEAGVPLSRPPFGIRSDGAPFELFRPARVSVAVQLGFAFDL